MLQAIRTRAGGIVVKTLFALLIVSFGFWGIYTRSPFYQSRSPDTVIATVGDHDIRAENLDEALRPALERLRMETGRAIDVGQAKQLGIISGLLSQLIDRSLLDQEASRLQLDVSDEVIRSVITGNPAFRGADGRFDRALFNQALAMNHMTEAQYVTQARRDIPASDLIHALTGGASMPEPVIDALYRYRNEKRVAEIVAFPVAGAGDPGQPSAAELTKFYDAHHDLFRSPELRAFTVASLTPDELAKGIKLPEEQVKKAYDERRGEFRTPEQRDVQQILAPNEAKAKQAAAALAQGKDWKTVATTIAGMDPSTIDLGLLKRQELPNPLSGIAFGLKLNQPSKPVKTPLGWHILRVVKIDPASAQSFAQVRPKLEARMARDEAVNRIYKLRDKLEDALAAGDSLSAVASKFGLKLTVVAAADARGRDPAGKPIVLPLPAAPVLRAVFAADKDQTSRVIQTQDDAIFVFRVNKITAPHTKPLSQVKGQAVAGWQAQKKRQMVNDDAKKLAAAVTAKTPLAMLAKERKLDIATTPPLLRRPTPGSTMPPVMLGKLFAAKPGAVLTAEDTAGAYVAQLKSVEDPKSTPKSAAASLSDELAASARLDLTVELTDALRRRYPVDIDHKALDRMF